MPVRHMATTNEGLIRAEANLAGAYLLPDKGHRHFVTAGFATLLFADPAYTTLLRRLKKNSCQCISTCAGHIVPHHIRSSLALVLFSSSSFYLFQRTKDTLFLARLCKTNNLLERDLQKRTGQCLCWTRLSAPRRRCANLMLSVKN